MGSTSICCFSHATRPHCFLTGGYRTPRRFLWVLGSLMFFLVLMEAEFGYALRDDFSSQWRVLQGADFYNGSGLGIFINTLNYTQIYGIHIIIVPFVILGLLFLHYGLVKLRGIATPYKKDYQYKIVKAKHTVLFLRGFVLFCVLILLSIIFPSPIIAPITIQQIASQDPSLMAKTLISEIDHSSDTATYSDNINPYQFDTKKIYVEIPYTQYEATQQYSLNMLDYFNAEDSQSQNNNLKAAKDYFDNKGQHYLFQSNKPCYPLRVSSATGQGGTYEAILRGEANTGYNPTYVLRFLSDTGALDDKADKLGITTSQYGMYGKEMLFSLLVLGGLPP